MKRRRAGGETTGGAGGEVKGKAVMMEQRSGGEVEKVEMGAKGRDREVSMRKTDSEQSKKMREGRWQVKTVEEGNI